ncbi:putative uncharacterized protein DDB_G0282133 [Oppia nitens]|uniref:putative uncharacterized protein DDB_G0282133 n=1 Tax=Oppia nitens TaxID=1686743 RepID=UPI0023DA977F|nr:putative uncharacterized protein DDB_G0282133 [Oppia nitens]
MTGNALPEMSTQDNTSQLCDDYENLHLIEEIGRGKYGCVWRASLNGQTVALKKFRHQYRQYAFNEKDIYLLSFMDLCPSLSRLMAFREMMLVDGRYEYQLAISYAALGSLQDCLKRQTIDWTTLCKMSQTITQGLAYLHTEVTKEGDRKPCVAHRDLTSRNILVNEDKSCMISDFQFAIPTSGSQYCSSNKRLDTQRTPLHAVGTLRYMAPEILIGAINLRECESALKQSDVYSLGLVLWEVASRCSDLYQGIEVPPYKQPFEKELGLDPTFEQMQVMVTRHKARPLFPDIWKDSNPAIRSLKETIEDCWDHDADARLTALCVVERLHELPTLWERYKCGTIANCIYSMPNQSVSLANNNNNNNNNNQKNFLRTTGFHNLTAATVPLDYCDNKIIRNEFQNNFLTNKLNYPYHSNNNNNNNNSNVNNYNNINTTEDSSTPLMDFEKNVISAANAFKNQPKLTFPLQPHQGRNPCLERNLMLQSSDDNTSVLLGQGFKFQVNASNTDSVFSDTFNDNNSNVENNALLTNDLLNRTTNDNQRNVSRRVANTVPPIPYVQNAVGFTTVPKLCNYDSNNGQSYHLKKTNETLNVHNSNESGFSKLFNWSNIKALKVFSNIKVLKQNNTNSEKMSIDGQKGHTFKRNNSPLLIKRDNCENQRVISCSLQNSIQSMDTGVNASTEPKVTQTIDLANIISDKSNCKLNLFLQTSEERSPEPCDCPNNLPLNAILHN